VHNLITLPRDLLTANAVMLLASLLLGFAGARSRRWRPAWIGRALAILALGVIVAYGVFLGDSLLLAKALPVADVMAWGNLQTPAMALLAGIAWAQMTGPAWQKRVLIGALVGIGLWRMAWPYMGTQPALGAEHWHRGVCVQTSKSTCAPAAAATLLARANIRAGEAEMTRLCLTHDDGTTMLGLFRGLKIKTDGTPYTVAVFEGTAADLRRQQLPAVISIQAVGLPSGILGVGNRHAVVVFDYADDQHITIGEPFTGNIQHWTLHDLQQVFQGESISLVRR
jgi:hypothetical protein